MKHLFLLGTCIILLLLLKQGKTVKKVQLERLDVEYSHTIDFTGKLFLPKTLQYGEVPVNEKVQGIIKISIAGKNYKYVQIPDLMRPGTYRLNRYRLARNSPDEIEVSTGTRIETDFKKSNLNGSKAIKFFAEKEIE